MCGEPIGRVDRRRFLNRAWLGALGVFGAAFGGGSLAAMVPGSRAGFGSRIKLKETPPQIRAFIRSERRPFYSPEGRFYLVEYDTSDPRNRYVRAGVAKGGLMAIYQKCAHLGCRVPFCETSQWFECPCHASRYNLAGEVQPGSPAPHGLYRFAFDISGDEITVDTSRELAYPEKGVDTLHQPPAGARCQ
jgi:cytochrome b6-f complex iron-sulfur subunit